MGSVAPPIRGFALGDDDVHRGRGVETAVGGDQWKTARDSQLDIQRVNQPQLMTPPPRVDEKVSHIVALDWCSDEVAKSGLDVLSQQVAGAMQASQCSKNLGVKVRRCVQRVTREPPTNGRP